MTLIFSLNHSYQITMTDYITQHLTTLSGAQYNLGNGGTSVLMNIDIGES